MKTGCAVRVAGCAVRGTSYGLRVPGCGCRVASCVVRVTRYELRGAGCRVQDTSTGIDIVKFPKSKCRVKITYWFNSFLKDGAKRLP